MECARKTIAEKIYAKPNEIFFTSSGSEGNSLILGQPWLSVDIDETSHSSVRKLGDFVINVDNFGFIKNEDIKNIKNTESTLKYCQYSDLIPIVSICAANNEIGTIQPIKKITKKLHEQNVLVHVDAVQLLPDSPIDVKDLDVDFM